MEERRVRIHLVFAFVISTLVLSTLPITVQSVPISLPWTSSGTAPNSDPINFQIDLAQGNDYYFTLDASSTVIDILLLDQSGDQVATTYGKNSFPKSFLYPVSIGGIYTLVLTGLFNGASYTINIVTALGVPSLTSPSDNVEFSDNTPTLQWSAVAGASQYRVAISDNTGFTSPTIYNTASSLTQYTLPITLDGRYYWRVAAVDSSGIVFAYSSYRSFVIDTVAPDQPIPYAPADAAVVDFRTPTLQWRGYGWPVSFEVEIDIDVLFPNPFYSVTTPYTVPTANPVWAEHTVTTPLSDGTYYWRLRATDAAGNVGNYNFVNGFIINDPPPSAPIHVSPLDGDVLTDTTPRLDWTSVADLSYYRIQVAQTNTFSNLIYDLTMTTSYYDIPSVLAEGTYYWRVQAVDPSNQIGPYSVTTSFSVAIPPGSPSLVSPSNGVFTTNTNPTLDWTDVTGAISLYNLQISTSSSFSTTVFDGEMVASTHFLSSITLSEQLYYWRVRTLGTNGAYSVWSNVWSFYVDPTILPSPILSLPFDTTQFPIFDSWPEFSWNVVSGASAYSIEVYDESSSLVLSTSVTAESYQSSFLVDGSYSWRVKAHEANGNEGPWSPLSQFVLSVSITLPSTSLSAPADTAARTSLLIPLLWQSVAGATGYQLQISQTNDFDRPLFDIEITGLTSYTIDLSSYGTFYWRVRAYDSVWNFGIWSNTWSFVTQSNINPPNIVSPVDGTEIAAISVLLNWGDLSGIGEYNVQLTTDVTFTTILYDSNVFISEITYESLIDSTYYWRVRGVEDTGTPGMWSGVNSFTINTVPSIISPSGIVNQSDVTLDWNVVAGIPTYNVQVSMDINFVDIIEDQSVSIASLNLFELVDGNYYWRVRSININGIAGDWSVIGTFTVDTDNSFTTATPVIGSFTGEVESPDEFDYFSIYLEEGQTLEFTITALGATMQLSFYNPDLSERDTFLQQTVDISFYAFETGTYYFLVLRYSGDTLTYTGFVDVVLPYVDPDDSFPKANALNIGSTTDRLDNLDFVDYYKIDLIELTKIIVTISSTQNIQFRFWQSRTNLITSLTGKVIDYSYDVNTGEAGTYYLVFSNPSTLEITYFIDVKIEEAVEPKIYDGAVDISINDSPKEGELPPNHNGMWYRIQLDAGTYYSFYLTDGSYSVDTTFSLYDENEVLLVQGGQSEYSYYEPSESGYYYVLIDADASDAIIEFILAVKIVLPGDIKELSIELFWSTSDASISIQDQVTSFEQFTKWFVFDANPAMEIYITWDGSYDGFISFEIFDPNDRRVESASHFAKDTGWFLEPTSTGKYYLLLDFRPTKSGSFDLSLTDRNGASKTDESPAPSVLVVLFALAAISTKRAKRQFKHKQN